MAGGKPSDSADHASMTVDAESLADASRPPVPYSSRARDEHAPTLVADGAVSPRASGTQAISSSLPRITLGFDESESPSAKPRESGTLSSDLVLQSLLGEGGMGVVYLGRQRSLRREVAVKCVRARHAGAADTLLHEARVAGGLEHPNIVPIHALGRDEHGGPVIVMKRIDGTPWRDLVDSPDHAAWPRLAGQHDDRRVAHLNVLVQVCNALEFAHSRGVIHRDIKPSNVMIGSFGEVYLVDWGVAVRITTENGEEATSASNSMRIVGTPNYMAPEMVSGNERVVDARTDVYLLGATLHEILTGSYRHEGETVSDVLLAATLSEPPTYAEDVPEELAQLCLASTARNPAHRPQSVAAFRQALDEFLKHRGSLALARTADEALGRFRALPGIGDANDTSALVGEEAHRHLTEARFGFLQALREWGGNEKARTGLDAALQYLAEREIAQRNPDAALALLREMAKVPDDLKKRVDRLAAEIAAQRERDERERREAREQDSSVSARVRTAAMILTIGAGIFMSVDSTRSEMRSGRPIPMSEALKIDFVMVGILAVAMVFARKKLFANRISRQLSWLAALVVGLGTVSDGYVAIAHGDSRTAGLHALMVYGTTLAVGALTILPGLWFGAVALFIGAGICAWRPVLTSGVVTFATLCSLLLIVQQVLKHGRRKLEDAKV